MFGKYKGRINLKDFYNMTEKENQVQTSRKRGKCHETTEYPADFSDVVPVCP